MKIETKLNVGDTGYYISDVLVDTFLIDEINISITREREVVVTYFKENGMFGVTVNEDKIFKTKQDLLDSL